jgi:hypothetical protein
LKIPKKNPTREATLTMVKTAAAAVAAIVDEDEETIIVLCSN